MLMIASWRNLLLAIGAVGLSGLPLQLACGSTGRQDAPQPGDQPVPAYHPDKAFNAYWYKGQAELTAFTLQQARYGQMRTGEAVMIFVTEHLHPQTHIKAYNKAGKDIPVLKLNFTRHFITGIYPYSIMTSVFTPVNLMENPKSLRVTFSSQEWCGHVFSIIDHQPDDRYRITDHSYFPNEGDETVTRNAVLLEDELWNRIRIDPQALPTGKVMIIPAMLHCRLRHIEDKPYAATATLQPAKLPALTSEPLQQYTLEYEAIERTLVIWHEQAFPFAIVKWEETVPSGFGSDAGLLTTTATRKASTLLDYWNRNALADTAFRKELQLGGEGF